MKYVTFVIVFDYKHILLNSLGRLHAIINPQENINIGRLSNIECIYSMTVDFDWISTHEFVLEIIFNVTIEMCVFLFSGQLIAVK